MREPLPLRIVSTEGAHDFYASYIILESKLLTAVLDVYLCPEHLLGHSVIDAPREVEIVVVDKNHMMSNKPISQEYELLYTKYAEVRP